MTRRALPLLLALAGAAPLAAQELPPPDTRTKVKPRPQSEERRGGGQAPASTAAPVLLLSTDLPCNVTVDGEPFVTLRAKEIRRVGVSAGQHLLVATSSDGRLRWQQVVDAKPGQQVVQIELATAGAVFSAQEFDRGMAGVWLGVSDLKVAGEYAASILGRAWGFHNQSLSQALHTAHEYLKRQVEDVAKMSPSDPERKRMREEVARVAQDADKYIGLMTKAVADAQKANSWQGEPSNMFAQARALEPSITFPDAALELLRRSEAFAAALPPDRRGELGLARDPSDFDLGVRYYQSTPALLAVVARNGLADKLGWKSGDRLISVDGQDVRSVWELKLALRAKAGGTVRVVFEREGERQERQVKVPSTLGR